MTTSAFSKRYEDFRKLLTQYRKDCSVTQSELADKLQRPQSFVSKYESGERRLDVVEFLKICTALQIDAHTIISELIKKGRI